jgi:hypothetical protein
VEAVRIAVIWENGVDLIVERQNEIESIFMATQLDSQRSGFSGDGVEGWRHELELRSTMTLAQEERMEQRTTLVGGSLKN